MYLTSLNNCTVLDERVQWCKHHWLLFRLEPTLKSHLLIQSTRTISAGTNPAFFHSLGWKSLFSKSKWMSGNVTYVDYAMLMREPILPQKKFNTSFASLRWPKFSFILWRSGKTPFFSWKSAIYLSLFVSVVHHSGHPLASTIIQKRSVKTPPSFFDFGYIGKLSKCQTS